MRSIYSLRAAVRKTIYLVVYAFTCKPLMRLYHGVFSVFLCVLLLSFPAKAGTPIPRSFTTYVDNIAYPKAAAIPQFKLPTPTGGNFNSPNWVVSGNATASSNTTLNGNPELNINQISEQVILDWASFDIGTNATVNFNQPRSVSRAYNRIHQADPSQIRGALNATGQVFLINQNGFIFGSTGRVNTSSFLASTLNLTDEAIQQGITNAISSNKPAFDAFTKADGSNTSKDIFIENGFNANITGAANGRFIAIARNIQNNGDIIVPEGQIILAAGNKAYVDVNEELPGWLVEVDSTNLSVTDGRVINSGKLIAEQGNISIVASTINQNGVISASTAVQKGGSIILRAQTDAKSFNGTRPVATRAGDIIFGENSLTEITIDQSGKTAADVTEQPESDIKIKAKSIHLKKNSKITATSGNVELIAREKIGNNPPVNIDQAGDGVIYIEGTIDVSGGNVDKSVSDNLLTIDLRADEFKNSPVQRNSVLRGEKIRIDIRKKGKRADGTQWQGTDVADVSGSIDGIQRTAAERNLTGGTIKLSSARDVVITPDAKLDISGGGINYKEGIIDTSKVISEGRILDISDVKANHRISFVSSDSKELISTKAGKVQKNSLSKKLARYESGYVEGKDAGEITIDSSGLLIAGKIIGNTTPGRYQRKAPSKTLPDNRLYRSYDEVPLTGKLQLGALDPQTITGVGLDHRLEQISFVNNLSGLIPDIDRPLDHPDFNNQFENIQIASDLLEGIGRYEFRTNKSIDITNSLKLPAFSELNLKSSQIKVFNDISSPGGIVKFTANQYGSLVDNVSIELVGNSKIDVSGRFINDNPFITRGSEQGALSYDGGKVSFKATGVASQQQSAQIKLSPGSIIDVSGGGYINFSGDLNSGDAGSITLEASQTGFEFNPSLSNLKAYGLNEAKGGRLTINSGDKDFNICQSGCLLNELAFSEAGFYDFDFTAGIAASFNIYSGTNINISPLKRISNYYLSRERTNADINNFSYLDYMPEQYNKPVSLKASSYIINVSEKSSIELVADPESRVDLSSTFQTYIDGTINVPAGTIALSQLKATDSFRSNRPESWQNHYIWLGKNARLTARGARRLRSDSFNDVIFGQIFDAGNIEIEAKTGYLVAEKNSLIDVSAISATLDIQTVGGRSELQRNVTVDGDAGNIKLVSREGTFLKGTLLAQASSLSGAKGGRLEVGFTKIGGSNSRTVKATNQYGNNDSARTIVITSNTIEASHEKYSNGNGQAVNDIVNFGDNIDNSLNGITVVSSLLLENTGIDTLKLSSYDFLTENSVLKAHGQVVLQDNLNLSLGDSLILNSPVILSENSHSQLNAPIMVLGSSDVRPNRIENTLIALDDPQAGTGSLTFNADFIEIAGRLALSGQESTTFNSRNDIRLTGLRPEINALRLTNVGELVSAGNINFNSSQIYASTLSDFAVRTVDTISSSERFIPEININSNGRSGTAVLSAASRLTFEANTINQNGTIKAPLGEINFIGRELTYNDTTIQSTVNFDGKSITSTSAEGQIIPFGTLQAANDWVYEQTAGVFDVLTENTELIPTQAINIDADNINTREGSKFDIRGGGDLLAYEFISGVDGTDDILDSVKHENTYAILPGYNPLISPYDPLISDNLEIELGQSVYFDAPESGLESGNYTLLPARYALLPGAYLVEKVAGYQDMVTGVVIDQTDGSQIIAGQARRNLTDNVASRNEGYRVLENTALSDFARYDTALASEFFSEKGLTGRLPVDDGRVSFTVNNSLVLNTQLLSQSGTNGGRGSQVDIAAKDIFIVGDTGNSSQLNNTIQLTVSQLANLGADSLLLGGTRKSDGKSTVLNVKANNVTVEDNVDFTNSEILLAAKDNLTVKSGASLQAAGNHQANSENIKLEQDVAIVRLSSFNQSLLTLASDEANIVNLNIEAGATLAASQAGLFSSSGNFSLSGVNLAFDDASLTLNSTNISLGETPVGVAGLSLTSTDINQLSNAKELLIDSKNGIDIYGDLNIQVKNNLNLRTRSLNSMTDDAQVNFNIAKSVRLENTNGTDNETLAGGTSVLTFNSQEIQLGNTQAGSLAINGFSNINLNAADKVLFDGQGSLLTSADIAINTPVLTATSNSRYAIGNQGNRTGEILITQSGTASVDSNSALGGRVELYSESDININSQISLNSGFLIANALGNINVGNKAIIDLSGIDFDIEGFVQSSPGGYFNAVSDADINLETDSVIDVSAGSFNEDAGTIELIASNGKATINTTLLAKHSPDSKGGEFILDAQSLEYYQSVGQAAFTNINDELNTSGFNRTRSFQLRTGDIKVERNKKIIASDIKLVADNGSIVVNGQLDARGEQAGNIVLAAKNTVVVKSEGDFSAALLANATAQDQHGGRIFIGATEGSLQLFDNVIMDVSGTDNNRNGLITLRIARNEDNNSIVNLPRIQSNFIGAYRVNLEAVKSYTVSNLTTSILTDIKSDTQQFMQSAGNIKNNILKRNEDYFHVTAGVEINSLANLTLASDVNLSEWHTNNEHSGYLTLRAANAVYINSNLEDGFASSSSGGLFGGGSSTPKSSDLLTTDSWNLRLVAGADYSSANPMAILNRNSQSENSNIKLAAGSSASKRYIRTGTGDINLAAAGDIELGNRHSVIYTAGRNNSAFNYDEQIPEPGGGLFGASNYLPYATDGGNISLVAGNNIEGAYSTQLVSEWLWRVSDDDLAGNIFSSTSTKTAWTVSHNNFEQNIGLFAGGNASVSAAGDIIDLSIVNSTTGSRIFDDKNISQLMVTGGGNTSMTALGDINGGRYLIDKGKATLTAYNAIGKTKEYPVFLVGDGSLDLNARSDVSIAGVGQWSLLPRSKEEAELISTARTSTLFQDPVRRFFFLYEDDNAVNVTSISGSTSLLPAVATGMNSSIDNSLLEGNETTLGDSDRYVFRILAPQLTMAAYSGDININHNIVLFPGENSDLQLFAGNRINFGQPVLMSDADKSLLPNVNAQINTLNGDNITGIPFTKLFASDADFAHASIPVASSINQRDNIDNTIPVNIVSVDGDIEFSNGATISTTKGLNLVSGDDLIQPDLDIQNLNDLDVSQLRVAGDIYYPDTRDSRNGKLQSSTNSIQISGPGDLLVMTGGDIDLGVSEGIQSTGNTLNTALPEKGANITLLAGVKEKPDLNNFVTEAVFPGAVNRDKFSDIVEVDITDIDIEQANQQQLELLLSFITKLAKNLVNSNSNSLFANTAENNHDVYKTLNAEQLSYLYTIGSGSDSNNQLSKSSVIKSLEIYKSLSSKYQQPLANNMFYKELFDTSENAARLLDDARETNPDAKSKPEYYDRGYFVSELLFENKSKGNLNMVFSQIRTLDGGDINILAPNGQVDVGAAVIPEDYGVNKLPEDLGMVVETEGNINSFSLNDFLVNESRVFTAELGSILIWTSEGDVDAGRGSKTALASPNREIKFDSHGNIIERFPPSLLGSGIKGNDITLTAPKGVINASDAGIEAKGDFIAGATEILGGDNLIVGGESSGTPLVDVSVSISLDVAGDVTSSVTQSVTDSVTASSSNTLSDNSLSLLFIEILNISDE